MLSPVKVWRNQKKLVSLLGKTGKIISWSMIRVPPANFSDQAPYPIVLVELTNHQKVTVQLVDAEPEHLRFGQPVKLVIRRVTHPSSEGVIPYGLKAKVLT